MSNEFAITALCPFCGGQGEHVFENGERFVRCTLQYQHRGATGCLIGGSGTKNGSGKCDFCTDHLCECVHAAKNWNYRATQMPK